MPIISSNSRKNSGAIPQLVNYVFAEARDQFQSVTVLHNINAREHDVSAIIQAFKDNDGYRKKRKNGIVLYHDILAFHPNDKQVLLDNPYILEELAIAYMEQRTPYGLGIAKLHEDKDHFHLHVILSPNERESTNSIRISRKKFGELKQNINEMQLNEYPQIRYSFAQRNKHQKKEREKQRKNSRQI